MEPEQKSPREKRVWVWKPKITLLTLIPGTLVLLVWSILPSSDSANAILEPVSIEVSGADQPAEIEKPLIPQSQIVPAGPPLSWREGRFGRKMFYQQMMELGMDGGTVHHLIDILTPVYNFRRSQPNHRWRLALAGNQPDRFSLHVSPSEIYDVLDLTGEPRLVRREVTTFVKLAVVRGQIEGSLFGGLAHAKDTAQLAARMERVFAWDINFFSDPRSGDTFEILVEERYIDRNGDAAFIGYGDILAARYFSGNKLTDAYRYEVDGKPGYFNQKGQSLVRDFLRSPLKLQMVTSSFNPRRFHPILKRVRPHNGVDYGASKNTPVMAVADGKVVTAGWYGGAGIAVEVKHRNRMLTQYFHLNKLAKGMRRGARVKQGQVIGYVGKTGLATGYHLHFGMKMNGRYVDPQKQRFEPGNPIPSEYLPQFRYQMDSYLSWLERDSAPRMVSDPELTRKLQVKGI